MIKEILKFGISKTFSTDIYNKNFVKVFNDYNKISNKNIDKIKQLYEENDCFKIPFIENNMAWGKEKVYLPFTTKLIKVINTNKGRTSIQFHPLKEECWYSLNDSSKYFDGSKWEKLTKFKGIKILENGIHSLERKSLILEIQDNNLFDKQETLRIKDFLNRKVDKEENYIKYLTPINKGGILKLNSSDYSFKKNNMDYFVFPFEKDVSVEYKDKVYNLEKQNLYFVKKGYKAIENDINAIFIGCYYYEKKRNS